MSKSHQQILPQKSIISTLQYYNRTRSNRFLQEKVPVSQLLVKGKQHYYQHRLQKACACFQQVWTSMSDPTPEVAYLLGLTLMGMESYEKAIPCLQLLESKYPNYKETVCMLLSICHNKTNCLAKAEYYINKQNTKVKSIESLFYSGKLALKQRKNLEALKYFEEVLTFDKNHLLANLYYCQCLQKLEQNEVCLKVIQAYLCERQIKDKTAKRMKYLKVACLLQQKKVVQAEQELHLIEKQYERTPEVLFYQAKVLKYKYSQSKNVQFLNQQILLLTELLDKNSCSKTLSWNALSQLILLHMHMKDFYEALHYTKRVVYLKLEESALMSGLTKTVEGITFLMKKNFVEAIAMIESVELNSWETEEEAGYLNDLYWNSLGYGYFCLGQHKKSFDMYMKVKQNDEELIKSSLYNVCLCEGILEIEKGNTEKSIKTFQTATDHLLRPEPYFYICVILVQKNIREGNISDILLKVLNILDAGLRVGENAQMYYYRGLIYLYLGMNAESIDDVDKAIQKSEDNVAKYFYFRALIFMHQRNYQQAISEFSTCLSIDEKFFDAYLQRAKAKVLSGDSEGAMEDLTFYPQEEEWKPFFDLYLGNYQNVINQKTVEESIIHIAQFQLGNFKQGGPAGKIVDSLIHKNYDQVLPLLEQAISINFPVGCLQIDDLFILKGFCLFKMHNFESCLKSLQKAEQLANKKQSSLQYHEQDEKKLLIIKSNIIFATLSQGNNKKATELCNALINDVYQGPIYEELEQLYQYLSGKIPYLEFKLFSQNRMISDEWQKQNLAGLVFQFYMMYPTLRILDIEIPQCEQPLIDFSIKEIQNRAEAPWIRKNQMGIMFTNEIQHFQGLNLNTEENQPSISEKQRIKQSLQLDVGVANKLEKFSVA